MRSYSLTLKKLSLISSINPNTALFTKIVSCFLLFICFSCQSTDKQKNLGAFNEFDKFVNIEVAASETLDSAEITISLVSWNIRDLGGSKNEKEIEKIVQVLRDFDVVAIQEVVAKDPKGAQAVAKIADGLNRSGSKWDYKVSDPTHSPSVYSSERYAFIWKTSKIALVNKPILDKQLEDVIVREPFIGLFKATESTEQFYVVNFHSRKFNEHPEKEIKYFKAYPERLKFHNILIAGDFNLDEKHTVWNPLYSKGYLSALKNSPTTLKINCRNGNYLNHSIDNNAAKMTMSNSGKIDFVGSCDNLAKARLISDHLPVFMEFSFK